MSLIICVVLAGLAVVGLAKFLVDEVRHDRDGQNPRM